MVAKRHKSLSKVIVWFMAHLVFVFVHKIKGNRLAVAAAATEDRAAEGTGDSVPHT